MKRSSVRIMMLLLAAAGVGCESTYLHTKHAGGPRDTTNRSWSLNEDGRWSSVQPWEFMGVQGKLIETPHWEIYTTIDNERFLGFLPEFYEAALERYRSALGELPPPPHAMAAAAAASLRCSPRSPPSSASRVSHRRGRRKEEEAFWGRRARTPGTEAPAAAAQCSP